MKSDYDPYSFNRFEDEEKPGKEEFGGFNDFVEFQQAQIRLTDWSFRNDQKQFELEAKEGELLEVEGNLERWSAELEKQERDLRYKRESLSKAIQQQQLDNDRQRDALTEIAQIVKKANVEPMQFIDEILLYLELEASREEILSHMREKREQLEVKW